MPTGPHAVLSATEEALWSRLGLTDEFFIGVDTVHYTSSFAIACWPGTGESPVGRPAPLDGCNRIPVQCFFEALVAVIDSLDRPT